MIDAAKPWGGTLLALAWLSCTAMAPQQAAAESITYRAESGVLDATRNEPTDPIATTPPEIASAEKSSVESAAKSRSGSEATDAFSGDSPFPSAVETAHDNAATPKSSSTGPLVTVTSSLAIVLGLFAGLVWLLRRSGGKATGQLPEEVFMLLGRTTLGPRQNITLARCGRRILVLAVSPSTTSTLAEITDPDEIADLAAQCGNGGSRHLFQRTLKEMGEQEPAEPGFIDPSEGRPTRGLFASG